MSSSLQTAHLSSLSLTAAAQQAPEAREGVEGSKSARNSCSPSLACTASALQAQPEDCIPHPSHRQSCFESHPGLKTRGDSTLEDPDPETSHQEKRLRPWGSKQHGVPQGLCLGRSGQSS
jgi:hypothetical protein